MGESGATGQHGPVDARVGGDEAHFPVIYQTGFRPILGAYPGLMIGDQQLGIPLWPRPPALCRLADQGSPVRSPAKASRHAWGPDLWQNTGAAG